MLEEKINKLGDRYIINGIYEGFKYVKVFIPTEWVLQEMYGDIDVQRDSNKPTQVVFGSDIVSISFSDIIDVILESINPYLVDLEKDILFNSYIDKLELIFKENELDYLKTLNFTFSGKQKRPYKKSKVEPEIASDKRELLTEDKSVIKSDIEISNKAE